MGKRILAALVAMAGLDKAARGLLPPPRGENGGQNPPGGVGSGSAPTLPRHLHRAVLRLLRPAESAARRLVIVAARDVVVELPPARPRKPKPNPTILRNGIGTGIVMPRNLPHPEVRVLGLSKGEPRNPHPEVRGGAEPRRTLSVPLFDPMRRPPRPRPSATGIPRISIPGLSEPAPLPVRRRLSRYDPIDASRLVLRLAALTRALDDLPREARRFARWRAARDTEGTRSGGGGGYRARRRRRIWPLRFGRPPGHRPAGGRRPREAVHDILDDTHGLAFDVLERPDTS